MSNTPQRFQVRVASNRAEGLDEDGGAWSVICVTHGTLVSVETRAVARQDARYARRAGFAEWCEECVSANEGGNG